MKWITISPGHYRLVDDSDERPSVKLRSKSGAPVIKYTPPWKVYEEGMKHQLSKDQVTPGDKFLAEREHQLKIDPVAKRWEDSRKASWDKDKPSWRREMMKKGVI